MERRLMVNGPKKKTEPSYGYMRSLATNCAKFSLVGDVIYVER